jgi:hypothetical protein
MVAFVLGVAPVIFGVGIALLRAGMFSRRAIVNLSRMDLKAFFLITTGIAGTLAFTRAVLGTYQAYAICFLPLLLPMIWLARYAVEDVWEVSARKNKQQNSEPDLSFLSDGANLNAKALRRGEAKGRSRIMKAE